MPEFAVRDLQPVLPWIATVSAVAYAAYVTYKSCCKKGRDTVNKCVQKDCDKVVHSFDIEDIADKAVYCRCWRSSKFPYCDGTHNSHNKETGDNVGPLIIKRKEA